MGFAVRARRGRTKRPTREYERFCEGHALDASASSSVRLYVVDRVDAAEPRTTVKNRINAIRRMAHESGRPDPTDDPGVRKSLKGALHGACRFMCGVKPSPATPCALRRCNATLPISKTASRRHRFERHPPSVGWEARSDAPLFVPVPIYSGWQNGSGCGLYKMTGTITCAEVIASE